MAFGHVTSLTVRALRHIAPAVQEEMDRWERAAAAIDDPFLRQQALASQADKRFHASGGSVYALAAPGRERELVTFIVALQTLCDYLDNLCDRGPSDDLQAYRCLHQAMLDAVDPDAAKGPGAGDYYRHYPHRQDGGYLQSLVATCQQVAARLPAVDRVRAAARGLVKLYSDLQVYKHGEVGGRRLRLTRWFAQHRARWPFLQWWEFAAAAGSTLGVFALFAAAADPHLSPDTVQRLVAGYFPWIGAWHILLDYLIDMEEDHVMGDLNFVAHYPDEEALRQGLKTMAVRSLEAASALPNPKFHRWIVQGLPALYLSDPKVKRQGLNTLARELLGTCGKEARFLHLLFRAQRHPVGRAILGPL